MVVRTRQPLHLAQIDRRDLTPLAPLRQKALLRIDVPAVPCEFALHRNADHTVVALPRRKLVVQEHPLGLVHANNSTVRAALRKKPPLGRKIPAHPVMTVQMVRREVGKHRNIRRQRPRQLGLIGAELKHNHIARQWLINVQNPTANIARQLCCLARRLNQMGNQSRCRRFAVRARHSHHTGWDIQFDPSTRPK